ncbi:unnamed protein product [Pelagomonas calceolata]|uniref:Uncharacterized protein n=1 Tax=Pelagomonas calceolata TaxID=35677 RepID=A0A8J2SS64_9STRA|nr:unnamed protein product [Pelagomonas calceolata]
MSLSTDADVAAAEGDLAALRVHADRLADGFVKRRLARHLETVADEVAAARRALAAAAGDAPTSAAAAAARTEARRALAAAAGAGVPRSPAEATAVALHFALLAVAGDSLRAVGAGAAAAVPGFAPRASELPAANRLPADWRRDDGGRFQYRSTSGEALELALDAARGVLRVALASRTRGVLHSGELAVGADAADGLLALADFERLAAYARGVLPRLAAPAPAPAPAPRRPPAPAVPGFAPAAPRRPAPPAPLAPYPDDGSGLLVGPGHPAFGGGAVDPLGAGRFRPRFDPIGPGGPGIPGPFGPGGLAGPRRPRLPGEPDDDHLRVPGRPGDGFGGGDPFI